MDMVHSDTEKLKIFSTRSLSIYLLETTAPISMARRSSFFSILDTNFSHEHTTVPVGAGRIIAFT